MAPVSSSQVVCCVAEKPSVCEAIAAGLSKKSAVSRKQSSPPVLEFEGVFEGVRATFRVTCVMGHVFRLDFAEAYRDWDACDPVELWDAPLSHCVTSGAVARSLRESCAEADCLVLFLDCDREGEAIAFEVVEIAACRRVLRAKFSAVAPSDLARAMANLADPDERLAQAVSARQELDLRVGVAFTRYMTTRFRNKYAGLDASTLSYGPVQTPALNLVVEREDEIASFAAEPYWTLELKGASILAQRSKWTRGRCFDRDAANALRELCDEADGAAVTSWNATQSIRQPPVGLNTVALLKLGSRMLNSSPQATMRAAERLYLDGLVSYPRTESTKYPDSFDLDATVQALLPGKWPELLIEQQRRRQETKMKEWRRGGFDAGDHPPISPVARMTTNDYSSLERRLYEAIVRHFLASLANPAIYDEWTGVVEIGGEHFDFAERALVDAGYLEILFDQMPGSAELLDSRIEVDAIRKGDSVSIENVVLKESTTLPPERLSEADLVGLMERHAIGTDASIAGHIETICKRNYVKVVEKRRLKPTPLGLALCRGLRRVDPDLVRPAVRAHVESLCDKIAHGQAERSDVVEHAVDNFSDKFRYFVHNVEKLETLFELVFAEKSFGDTKRRGRRMNFVRDGPTRTHFSFAEKSSKLIDERTDEIFALPRGGTYLASGGVTCPECSSEAMWYRLADTSSKKTVTYPLCHRCFLATASDDAAVVTECPLPDSHPLVLRYSVGQARDLFGSKANGVAILEPHSTGLPKIVSTRNPVFIASFAPEMISSVKQKKDRLIEVNFVDEKSPLDNKDLVCTRRTSDPLLRSMLRLKELPNLGRRKSDSKPPVAEGGTRRRQQKRRGNSSISSPRITS